MNHSGVMHAHDGYAEHCHDRQIHHIGVPLAADETISLDAMIGVSQLIPDLMTEVRRQDAKHGRFTGTDLGRSRLAVACLSDEYEEALDAWRAERKATHWHDTTAELLQVAAVALRAIRDMRETRP